MKVSDPLSDTTALDTQSVSVIILSHNHGIYVAPKSWVVVLRYGFLKIKTMGYIGAIFCTRYAPGISCGVYKF